MKQKSEKIVEPKVGEVWITATEFDGIGIALVELTEDVGSFFRAVLIDSEKRYYEPQWYSGVTDIHGNQAWMIRKTDLIKRIKGAESQD
jgi:hypothetical protein